MYKEHTEKKSDISIFFRDEKIRVGMEWPKEEAMAAAKTLLRCSQGNIPGESGAFKVAL